MLISYAGRVLLITLASLFWLTSGRLMAQEAGPELVPCTTGVISEIRVRTLQLFEESGEPVPAANPAQGFMDRVYRAGEKIHVKTKDRVIRADMLLREGDCFDEFLLSESLRVLRGQIYISTAEAEVIAQEDGSVVISLVTRDDWSLKVSLGLSVDEGLTIEGLGVSEVNFLGSGSTLGIIRSEDQESLEYGLEAVVPRLSTTALDASLQGGATRTGFYFDEYLRRPFRSEQDRWAARERVQIREDVFAYSTGDQESFSHLVQEFRLEEADLSMAYRIGRPGHFWVLGGGPTWEAWRFPTDSVGLYRVTGGDFDDLQPAESGDADVVQHQSTPASTLRMNVEIGYRGVRFLQRENLDAVAAVQDLRLGPEFRITLGKSVGSFGPNPRSDWFSRSLIQYGWATDRWAGGVRLLTEARYETSRPEDRWRDIQGETDIYTYFQPSRRHTLFARISAAGMENPDRPFQLTLGGRDGVRGYSRYGFPGAQRGVVTVEDRIRLDWPDAPWGDVGLVVFADAGRMVAADVPYGVDSGWLASVGAGFRLAFPGGSPRATRIEFSYPLTGHPEQAVYFRFYADILGLLRGFDDDQMVRSRWGGLPQGLERR